MWKVVAVIVIVGAARRRRRRLGIGRPRAGSCRRLSWNQPSSVRPARSRSRSTRLTARSTRLDVTLEQGGTTTPVFTLIADNGSELERESPDRLPLTRAIGKQQFAELKAGARKDQRRGRATRAVRLPRGGVRSKPRHRSATHSAADRRAVAASLHQSRRLRDGGLSRQPGLGRIRRARRRARVSGVSRRREPASSNADPALRVAFFALLWDQDLNAPISVFARDEIGNEGSGTFDHRVFPKTFRKSRIELDDAFLGRVVPAILQNSTELTVGRSDQSDRVVLCGSIATCDARTTRR